ncbi:DMT family transporter [Aerococcus urinae]|uniref:DMT family transporter n=1 Tax=Aerococcus urinae TaxID=1376 RepID=UPI00254D7856|nr:DMT family transporter [Aerococcus urinae]MDK6375666.1 DMT family transporter [Aerococcus urinae]MDK6420891.1 DMT family transporter [Aerococcus urinae]MDK8074560.1 DMT family transporter [Aerococcus urinae]MDK8083989.1 DMT family transporter [Aerococcus urinae]
MNENKNTIDSQEEKKPAHDKKKLGNILLLIVAFLWGSSLTVVKGAQAYVNPNMILAIRFSVAALILAVVFWKKVRDMTKDDLKSGVSIGVFLFLAYSIQTVGVGYTDPGRSAFLSASYCVLVPFISWLVMKKRPDKFNVAAAIFCIIGIYFVSMAGGSENSVLAQGRDAIIGDLLALLSGVFFASHIVAVTKFSKGKDPYLMTILQFGTAAVLSALTTFFFEDNSAMVINQRTFFELAYLAIMCTAVALLFQNIGQKYTDETSAALILSLESVFGILIPVFLGIEGLTIYTVIGFAMIFIAILISETKLSFLRPNS